MASKDMNKDRVGKKVPFQRIRRITCYLVPSLQRFNKAKRQEEKARVKHNIITPKSGKSVK